MDVHEPKRKNSYTKDSKSYIKTYGTSTGRSVPILETNSTDTHTTVPIPMSTRTGTVTRVSVPKMIRTGTNRAIPVHQIPVRKRYRYHHIACLYAMHLLTTEPNADGSQHLDDIFSRCLRNAPLKIVTTLEECPSQDHRKS
ncbi:hypothetical protein V6N12_048791 [Hibiscus sabdariffa]|uniref:Uncharacterized protein n=1 Tax=Hibiscus sabdariffa TaxID=183260 RepID=A0ABR2EIA3_9ROSI